MNYSFLTSAYCNKWIPLCLNFFFYFVRLVQRCIITIVRILLYSNIIILLKLDMRMTRKDQHAEIVTFFESLAMRNKHMREGGGHPQQHDN